MIDYANHPPRSGGCNSNAEGRRRDCIQRHVCIRLRQLARTVRPENNAVTSEFANHAILDVKLGTGVELYTVLAGTDPVEQESAQADGIARPCVDRDAVSARHSQARKAVALDADRLADGEGAIASGIKHV